MSAADSRVRPNLLRDPMAEHAAVHRLPQLPATPPWITYDTPMSIKKVLFGAVQIQKLRRVALHEQLLATLGLAVGDRVTVELDVETESIIIRKLPNSPGTLSASGLEQ